MSETLADDADKQSWEHSIKSYSVRNIGYVRPRLTKRQANELIFEHSKLHVVQVTNDSFVPQLRNLENPLHFSSLTMSETKFAKFVFKQNHRFTAFVL